MVKRAVLIGINQYEDVNVPDLNGCVGDAESMSAVLTECYEFEQGNLVELIQPGDTKRDAILSALTTLVDGTQSGDVAVVYYSGHGSQVPDTSGDEKDGLDETIVPSDSHRGGGPVLDITDDELHSYIFALAQKTPYTTFIFDSCHSGSIDRDLIRAGTVQAIRAENRPIPRATMPASQSLSVPERKYPPVGDGAGGEMSATGLIQQGDYLLLAGCRDDEVSLEANFNGEAHGLLTRYLVDRLRTGVNSSMAAIAATVQVEVEADSKRREKLQHPVFEGPAQLREAPPFSSTGGEVQRETTNGNSQGAQIQPDPAPNPQATNDPKTKKSSPSLEWDAGFANRSALTVIAILILAGLAFGILTAGVLGGVDDSTKVTTVIVAELAFIGLLLGGAGVYLALLAQRGRSHVVENTLAVAAGPNSETGERGIDVGDIKGTVEAVGKMPTARALIVVGGLIVAGAIALAWHVLPDPQAGKAPTISKQPASVRVPARSRTTFAVSASGTDLAYAWKRDGKPIPGSGSSSALAVGPVAKSQNGAIYSVVVSNDNGQATSKGAKLTVKQKKKTTKHKRGG